MLDQTQQALIGELPRIDEPETSALETFNSDESGAVLLEYVTLLIQVFITCSATAAFFINLGLVPFARSVFEHLNMP